MIFLLVMCCGAMTVLINLTLCNWSALGGVYVSIRRWGLRLLADEDAHSECLATWFAATEARLEAEADDAASAILVLSVHEDEFVRLENDLAKQQDKEAYALRRDELLEALEVSGLGNTEIIGDDFDDEVGARRDRRSRRTIARARAVVEKKCDV